MKRTYQSLRASCLIGAIAALLCTACSKDTTADRLKGKWQLQTVEAEGGRHRVDTVWYNFQSESLFMYQIYQPAARRYVYTYGYKTQPDDRTLRLQLANYTIKVKDFLPLTDWPSGVRTFRVEHVDGRQLRLESDGRRYMFRRY